MAVPSTQHPAFTPTPAADLRADFTVSYGYQVHFTADVFAPSNPVLAGVLPARAEAAVLAVLDSGVADAHPGIGRRLAAYAAAHPDRMHLAGEPLVLPGGEASKNDPGHLGALLAAISDRGLCRHSYVLAVGGGAVLDVAGYATAVAHRGLRLVRVPTTTLAQADAGIGVKNGVNAFGRKNFIGSFAPPAAVINDLLFLTTLPSEQWRAGMSEAVKVACVKDPDFFAALEQDAGALSAFGLEPMSRLVRRCAELHLRHIADGGDPFESGSARPLDFGHWAAHQIERLSRYRVGHGDAVALGIAIDTAYAARTGLLPETDRQRIFNLLAALGLRRWTSELLAGELQAGLQEFREHLGGRLTITLPRAIGREIDVHDIDTTMMTAAVRTVHEWASGSPS